MKKRTKVFIISLCIFIITVSVGTLIGIVCISAYTKKNVDLENDERLFGLAKIGSYTEYYANAADGFSEKIEYLPEKLDDIALGEYKKQWVELDEISKFLQDGFIAVEDRSFYDHNGVDLKRTAYAALNELFGFKKTFGASTITQQVVKNVSGDNEITIKRKLNEIIRAYSLEQKHSKYEIFETYLNIVPMGNNIYGVKSASEKYFGKDVLDLDLAEAATLIGITNAPSRYDPYKNPDACREKRNNVLYAMLECGVVDKEEYENSILTPLAVNERDNIREKSNSWFIETVNKDVISDMCEKYSMSEEAAKLLLSNGGLRIYTTENKKAQSSLESYFSDEGHFPEQIRDGLEFSMVICDSRNGDLIAIIGSVGEKSGNMLLNHALVPHTPGSSLKPLALYAPLIDEGSITWSTVFDDVPLSFNASGGTVVPYPVNYPRVYSGLTTVKDAIRLSKNTVAMRLYDILGAERIYSHLKYGYGFDSVIRKKYSSANEAVTDLAAAPLALGQLSYGVPLRRLTEAYTSFSSEGIIHEPRSYVKVEDAYGNVLLERKSEGERLYSKEGARLMNMLLSTVIDCGTASSVTLKSSVDVAGKTGTSGNDKDRLFIGYTPYYCAGIWCGYPSGDESIGKIAPTHLKIWDDVMSDIHSSLLSGLKDKEVRAFSTLGLEKGDYCKDSGLLFSPTCSLDPRGSRLESGYFLHGTVSHDLCDRHVAVDYDMLTGAIANDYCPRENLTKISLIKVDERHFDKQIVVSDADYVYMPLPKSYKYPESFELPYYYCLIAEDDYIGIGPRRKQYNSGCYIHDGD